MVSPARQIPSPPKPKESTAITDALGEWIRSLVPADVIARVAHEDPVEIEVADSE